MPNVRILQEASEEAEAAAAWYETERRGLGAEFAGALESAIQLIEEGLAPLAPMPGGAGNKGAKRLILRRFPYDIITIERDDEIIIVAFVHHSRRPGYWRDRLLR